MSNQLRFQVVEEAFKKKAVEVAAPAERPSQYFGKYGELGMCHQNQHGSFV